MIKCCKDCEDREIGCHSKCEKYLQEKLDLEKIKQIIKKKKEEENFWRK